MLRMFLLILIRLLRRRTCSTGPVGGAPLRACSARPKLGAAVCSQRSVRPGVRLAQACLLMLDMGWENTARRATLHLPGAAIDLCSKVESGFLTLAPGLFQSLGPSDTQRTALV